MQEDRRLANQGFSEVAPSTPETSNGEGLQGAYASETLIGETGRTVHQYFTLSSFSVDRTDNINIVHFKFHHINYGNM